MDWMLPGWRTDLDAAYESACRLGEIIATQKKWNATWTEEWRETVSEVYEAVKRDRDGLLNQAAALVSASDPAGYALAFWKGLSAAILLDADPKTGPGSPPDGYGDLYMVAMNACGAVRSEQEAQQAAGLWATISGTVLLTAEDIKEMGKQIPEIAKSAGDGIFKVGLGLGALYLLSKVL